MNIIDQKGEESGVEEIDGRNKLNPRRKRLWKILMSDSFLTRRCLSSCESLRRSLKRNMLIFTRV
jgi:hypothetical protein